MQNKFFVKGFVPAVFTPLSEDGNMNLKQVKPLVDHLISGGAAALFVVGSAGEGISLTSKERMELTEAFVDAAAKRIPVIAHVGHTSIYEARELAAHAAQAGVDSICTILPSYFKPGTIDETIRCLDFITAAAPATPFYYYHIPGLVNLPLDIIRFAEACAKHLPSFVGIKYSWSELQYAIEIKRQYGDELNLLFGVDEMVISGMAAGADGAVGSTYNFLLPICNAIQNEFTAGHIQQAQELQAWETRWILSILKFGGLSALKETMRYIGVDCGPVRMPLTPVSPETSARLFECLKAESFFEMEHIIQSIVKK